MDADGRLDHKQLIDLLEAYLLGEEPSLTGNELADEVGIPFETARQRWRSLGFTAVGGDVPAFTHADLEALRLTQRLSDLGFVEPDDESALVRTPRPQLRPAGGVADGPAGQADRPRHDGRSTRSPSDGRGRARGRDAAELRLAPAHARRSPRGCCSPRERDDDATADEPAARTTTATTMGVGFADIVNYTRQSRSLSRSELAALVDDFEARALEIVTAHDGRIIKTIGDEILFVADDADRIARIGLELVEERERDEDFPELRVGLAWGPALARLGDVLGPVVNVASRLTSTSRPGRVLVDRRWPSELEDDEHFKLRRLRRTSVRGYRSLEPWSLRRGRRGPRPGGQCPSAPSSEQSRDLLGVVDEVGARRERPSVGEGARLAARPAASRSSSRGRRTPSAPPRASAA